MQIKNVRAVRAAAAVPIRKPGRRATALEKTRYSEARAWYKSFQGRDDPYRELVYGTMDNLDKLTTRLEKAATAMKMAAGRRRRRAITAARRAVGAMVWKLAKNRRKFLRERRRLTAIRRRSAVENKMLAHTRNHIRLILQIIRGWRKNWRLRNAPRLERDVSDPADDAVTENDKAYRDLPEEADAFAVGDRVGAEAAARLRRRP